MGFGDGLLAVSQPDDQRQRRRAADYAEDKLLTGRPRQERKQDRQAQKTLIKQALRDIGSLGSHPDVYALVDSLLERGVATPKDRARARRLERALDGVQATLLVWIDVLQLAAREHPDALTPYGTRVADDAAVAIRDWRMLLGEAKRRRELLRGLIASQTEQIRHLAWAYTGRDYVSAAQGASVAGGQVMADEPEPVSADWLERFALEAEQKRTPHEPAFPWEQRAAR